MLRLKKAIEDGIPPIIAVRISKELYHYYVISGYNDDLQVVVCEEVGGGKTLLPYETLNAIWAATGYLFLTIEPPTAASTFEEGVEYETVGNYERAIEHYKHALQLDPEFYEARIGMGNCHIAKGELVEARREYEAVLSQIPGTPSLWNNLAHVYAELGIRLDQAEELVGKAVERYQKSRNELILRAQRTKNEADRFLLRQELNDRTLELMYARGTLGQVRFKRKSWTLAIAAWTAALEVAPLDYFDFRAKRNYEIALAYRELGQASDARRHLGKAMEIVKEPELRKKIEKALQQ
jgi:tetratricopeptide (TPR) repeat protein